MAITNLTKTIWVFNETVSGFTSSNSYNINFVSDGTTYNALKQKYWGYCLLDYQISSTNSITTYGSSGWKSKAYQIIAIIDGDDVENADLITFLENNAQQLNNLTGTKWHFNEKLDLSAFDGSLTQYNINFVCDSVEYNKLGFEIQMGSLSFMYYYQGETQVPVVQYSSWDRESFKDVIITGGADVENADLMSFLQTNAQITEIIDIPVFGETKTSLKIYEDLTQSQYDVLSKEPNSFYLVNDVGVYKGNKLIALGISTNAVPNNAKFYKTLAGNWNFELQHDDNTINTTDVSTFANDITTHYLKTENMLGSFQGNVQKGIGGTLTNANGVIISNARFIAITISAGNGYYHFVAPFYSQPYGGYTALPYNVILPVEGVSAQLNIDNACLSITNTVSVDEVKTSLDVAITPLIKQLPITFEAQNGGNIVIEIRFYK